MVEIKLELKGSDSEKYEVIANLSQYSLCKGVGITPFFGALLSVFVKKLS